MLLFDLSIYLSNLRIYTYIFITQCVNYDFIFVKVLSNHQIYLSHVTVVTENGYQRYVDLQRASLVKYSKVFECRSSYIIQKEIRSREGTFPLTCLICSSTIL